jgi:type 1 glutamine amidotransferase
LKNLVLLITIFGLTLGNAQNKHSITFKGTTGPGLGKKIVFIASDHEYRGEETLPALARILAEHHGFECTVIWALDDEGNIHPGSSNIAGFEALKEADLMVMFVRFADFPDTQMQHLNDYLERGGPVIGLRTSTHAFKNKENQAWNHYDFQYNGNKTTWKGGFGERILGETWVGHYGTNHEQSSLLILEESQKEHPILNGVSQPWVQCGGYRAWPIGPDLEVLALGRILNGMSPEAPKDTSKREMPVVWTRTYSMDNGVQGKVFTTTHGASEDILNDDFRRLLINAHFWALGMEKAIKPNLNIEFIGPYTPSKFSFDGYKKGVRPVDLQDMKSPIMPQKE